MKLYEITELTRAFDAPPSYRISAETKYGLPGLNCPRCSAWGTLGVYYPSTYFSELDTIREFCNSWPVSPQRFMELVELVRRHLGHEAVLPPGTRFGPLVGTCIGVVPAFAWATPWTPLANHDAIIALESFGIDGLTIAETSIRTRRGGKAEVLQLDIRSGPALADLDQEQDLCSFCGRYCHRVPDQIRLRQSDIPTSVPLFRIRHLEAVILCTQDFKDAVSSEQIPNIDFREVEVEC